ncbi:aspartic peptidase domain-containing protein [Aspergillus pseudoustus]|uniref:Aspartic peptidase domain-containing protein n=1 Tax=Aspergillus pseudoustus TaxID=1810923 RepID=A0ABR4KIG0_9EURO
MYTFRDLLITGLLVGPVASTTLPLRRRATNVTSSMVSTTYGSVFDTEVTIGGQSFQLLVDSGSSDTYVMKTGFRCFDKDDGLELTEEECLYDLDRTYNISDTYEEIPNQIFGIQYGAGLASGVMAWEEVKIAGVTVPRQRVAIADKSNPMGDGISSGLLGLAYPSLTSAHPANITDNSTYYYNRIPYKPLLFTMYDEGLIADSYFSHVIARNPTNQSVGFGGYLSLGELPPVKHSDNWAVAPVEIIDEIPLNFTSYKRTISYWALTIPSVSWGRNSSDSKPFQAFFDTGNPLSYLPGRVSIPFNELFSPPGVYSDDLGAYVVDCNAKPPSSLVIEIDGQKFDHNSLDFIYQTGEDLCISTIGVSERVGIAGLPFNILGVPFLKNVVGVFDFGRDEMRFANDVHFDDGSTGTNTTTGDSGDSSDGYVPGNGAGRVTSGGLAVAGIFALAGYFFTL